MPKPSRGGGRPPGGKKKKTEAPSVRPDDVYEAEDSDPDELRHADRFDVSCEPGNPPSHHQCTLALHA